MTSCIMTTLRATRAAFSTAQTVSPSWTSLAFLRVEQHASPTGMWCSGVRVSNLSASVVSVTKVASASGLAIERSETVSVVRAPSAVAATILSPSLSASTRAVVPLAQVTSAEEEKHGSSVSESGTVRSAHAVPDPSQAQGQAGRVTPLPGSVVTPLLHTSTADRSSPLTRHVGRAPVASVRQAHRPAASLAKYAKEKILPLQDIPKEFVPGRPAASNALLPQTSDAEAMRRRESNTKRDIESTDIMCRERR